MKAIILIAFLFFMVQSTGAQSSLDLWSIRFSTIDSFQVDMNGYKGQTLLFFSIDASNPDITQVLLMDSINRKQNGNVAVIGVLVKDFGNALKREAILRLIRAGRGISFPITNFTKWKTDADSLNRHQLVRWLEENKENKHFKIIPREAGQMFFVSKKPSLYAVLDKRTVLSKILFDKLINRVPQ